MNIRETIKRFPEQFDYKPEIINFGKLEPTDKFIVCGMGGSHLGADLLKTANPYLDLLIHKDYGLPRVPEYFLNEALLVFSSYSGNTEEIIDGLREAMIEGLNVAVITSGGKLLAMAEKSSLPYIKIPEDKIQPRLALGYSILGLLKLTGQAETIKNIGDWRRGLVIEEIEREAGELSKEIQDKVPLVYSSTVNQAIALNWKIKLNETGKVPAWYNLVPELNHNELAGWDYKASSKKLSENNVFIILRDENDAEKIKKRMDITKELLEEKNFRVLEVNLSGRDIWEKMFRSLLLADLTALMIAEKNGAEPEQVAIVENLKKRMLE